MPKPKHPQKPREYLAPPKNAYRKLSSAEIKRAVEAVKSDRGSGTSTHMGPSRRRDASRIVPRKRSPLYLDPPKSAYRKLSDEIIEQVVAEVIAERKKAS